MSKYLVLCDAIEVMKTFSEKEAQGCYANAVKSQKYSSVVLRIEEKTHGYAVKSWSKEYGESFMV